MTIDDLLVRHFEDAAARLDVPPSDHSAITRRGARRRAVARVGGVGAGLTAAVALLGAATFVFAAADTTQVAITAAPAPLGETPVDANGVVQSIEGVLVADELGYLVHPVDGSDPHRIVEAHGLQVQGSARFGPAVTDGRGGFVYSVLDVDDENPLRPGWVLWVPAGQSIPRLVSHEPEVGIGEVFGLVTDADTEYVVYTTAAGRRVEVRRVPLEGGTAESVIDAAASGSAAGAAIITYRFIDGCTDLQIHDAAGRPRTISPLPVGCPDIPAAYLSPDGSSLAYLQRSEDGAAVAVVDTATGRETSRWTVPERRRLLGFDGQHAYLTTSLQVDVTTGETTSGPGESGLPVSLRINDRLVLQVPEPQQAIPFEVAQAIDRPKPSRLPGAEARYEAYTRAGWRVTVAASAPTTTGEDLDAFGVTSTGLGPYALGAGVQDVVDHAGHQLMSQTLPLPGCRAAIVSPLHEISREDLTISVVSERVVALEMSTPRFTFDGLGVGSTLDEVKRRFPDSELEGDEAGNTVMLIAELPESDGTVAIFRSNGTTVSSYLVGFGSQLLSGAACT